MNDTQTMNYCRQLSDFDPAVRRFAVKKLIELVDPISVPYLISSLNDEDIFVKTNAEDALFKIGEPVVPLLVKSLLHDVAEVRLRALSVYRRLETSELLEYVVPLINDEDLDVRNLALNRLQKNLTKSASKSLWDYVKNSRTEEALRDVAISLLNQHLVGIGEEIVNDLQSSELDLLAIKVGCQLVAKFFPEGHEFFVDKYDSEIPEMRIAALLSLLNLKPETILSLAKKATSDPDNEVRKAAVSIIGQVGGHEELQLLFELQNTLASGVWQVSKQAISDIENRL
ncbi:MAG: HEAT repeat domain-containing protein [Candidatus Kariarchaeaceae archaeon]|jgi:HEAT repeat protein